MATIKIPLDPRSAVPASTNGGRHAVVDGTNFPVASIKFDPGTIQTVYWQFMVPNYGSGNLTLDILWYADTASTSTIVWGCQISAITPDTDTQDVETDGLATAQTVTDTHLGTTGQRVHKCTITISNLDSIAADDYVTLAFYRDATNGSDLMSGDAQLLFAQLSYSDT